MRFPHKKALLAAAAALILLLGAACAGQQSDNTREPAAPEESSAVSPEEPSLPGPLPQITGENYPRVDGSTSNMPLMARLYSVICGVSPETAEGMVMTSGGTGAAWYNMLFEGADLLLIHQAPETVREAWEESGPELEITPLGLDGLVFLVNRENPVDNLTTGQLQGIYTGEITDWSQVGGEAGEITPFQRNAESGSQTLFLSLLMAGLTPMDPPTELVPASMAGLIDEVAAFDGSGGAIGYSVYQYAGLMYQNPDLKLLSVDGVAPSFDSIRSGGYPLTNPYFTVIRADEAQDSPARLLRDWLHTDAGKALMTEADYIPVP